MTVITRATVSMITSLGWILYAITVGVMAVAYDYSVTYLWISIVVAIVGNSAHMVALSLSKSGFDVTSALPGKVN